MYLKNFVKDHASNMGGGTAVNLERSLKMGDEMGGHMVSGHVDGWVVKK